MKPWPAVTLSQMNQSSQENAGWTAIVLAGSRPGVDPLAEQFGLKMKSLIHIDGEVMVSRVTRTLLATPSIERVVVMAQDVQSLKDCDDFGWTKNETRLYCVQSGNGISQSILEFLNTEQTKFPLLVTTADNVLLTTDIATEFLGLASDSDISFGMVAQKSLTAQYPDNRRTWMHFRCGAYTGANLFAFRSSACRPALELWQSVERDRKKVLRIAARFGPTLMARVLTRSISLKEAVVIAGNRLGVEACAVILTDPDAGIDVDKPSDFALAEKILRSRRSA